MNPESERDPESMDELINFELDILADWTGNMETALGGGGTRLTTNDAH